MELKTSSCQASHSCWTYSWEWGTHFLSLVLQDCHSWEFLRCLGWEMVMLLSCLRGCNLFFETKWTEPFVFAKTSLEENKELREKDLRQLLSFTKGQGKGALNNAGYAWAWASSLSTSLGSVEVSKTTQPLHRFLPGPSFLCWSPLHEMGVSILIWIRTDLPVRYAQSGPVQSLVVSKGSWM